MLKEIFEPARKIKVVRNYDVVVVGGGMAGAASAVAASKNGARVCLIEKESSLGGLATLGLIISILPLCDAKGNKLTSQLEEDFLDLASKYAPELPRNQYNVNINPASYVIALEEFILNQGIDIFYDTRFCDVSLNQDNIEAIIVENKSGRFALQGKTFIDATGDADVCYQAGEETFSLNTNQRCSWFYSFNGEDLKLKTIKDPVYEEIPYEIDNIYRQLPEKYNVKTYAGDNGKDVSEMIFQTRKLIVEELKKQKDKSNSKNIYPFLIPTLPQFRMTRRLTGQYLLDDKDEHTYFDDAIGLTGYWKAAKQIFYIPYQSLIGGKIGNLLTAGRCISANNSAWNITRLIKPCLTTGEAAGTAATLACKDNLRVQDISILKLQNLLKDQGVMLDNLF